MSVQMPIDLACLSDAEFREFIEKFDVIFCDCDGVLWSFRTPFPGACESINGLKTLNKRVYLVTNNSQTNREEMLMKCEKIGYNLTIDNILTSTYIVAHYLKSIGFNKTAYVIGQDTVGKDLDTVGIKHIGIGPDLLEGSLVEYVMKRYELDENVEAVIVGFDPQFSFPKLCKAVNYLKKDHIKFFATNAEGYFDLPQFDFLLPEAGCFLKAIEAATKRKPEILSKPSTHICKIVAENSPPFESNRAIIIGDNLDTDITFGKNAGYSTLFVGTGTSSLKDVEEAIEKINLGDDESVELKKKIPDYYISSFDEFYRKFTKIIH